MSAAEVIEQIKALPREEQQRVREFVSNEIEAARSVRYASDEQARVAGDAVVAEFPETFRRLAE